MKPFFTEADFQDHQGYPLEARLCAKNATDKVQPLLERLGRYEIVEKAAKELNERLRTQLAAAEEALTQIQFRQASFQDEHVASLASAYFASHGEQAQKGEE